MKAKYSSFLDEASGKIGSVVASTGRGGAYLRARVVPFNPRSVDQVTARARLTTFAQGWSALTENQRTQWNAAVDGWKSTDVFGMKVTPSGINLYVALNTNLAIIGVAAISVPPAITAVPVLTSLAATQVHAGATAIQFAPSPLTAGAAYVIAASAPMSAGRNFAKGSYRFIKHIAAGVTTPQVITTEYNAKFGGPGTAGQKVFVKVYGVDIVTGRKGAEVTCVAVVS